MNSIEKIIAKLRRPPAAHNWVKNIRPRRDDTAFALRNFAVNPPRISLQQVSRILAQIVIDDLSLEDALRCTLGIKDPSVRERAKPIIRAFHAYARGHGWTGIEVFKDLVAHYHVAAGVKVPVKPTFVINQDGVLVPYFVICWVKMDLTIYQRRILSTMIYDAILTLEEFLGSDAVIVCTPRCAFSRSEREVVSWKVSDFPVLSDDEKQDLFDRYAGALEDAEEMIIELLS